MQVSFVVPIYNLSYLAVETLKSLMEQSFCMNSYEVIAIDDCSNDKTYELINDWINKNDFNKSLKFIRNENNLGLKETMRRLLELASGDFVCYVDGDDLVSKDKLRIQHQYMLDNPSCTISYHESDMFDSGSGQHLKYFSREHYNFNYVPQKGNLEHLLKYSTFIQASSVMIKNSQSLVDALDHENNIICDYPWHIGILAREGGTVDYIPNVLGKYRIHDSSFGAETQKSPERRVKVAHELVHAIELAIDFDCVHEEWVQVGKAQTYFAAALYFLRLGNRYYFEMMLNLSLKDNVFFDKRHKFLLDNIADFDLCKASMEKEF